MVRVQGKINEVSHFDKNTKTNFSISQLISVIKNKLIHIIYHHFHEFALKRKSKHDLELGKNVNLLLMKNLVRKNSERISVR